MKNKLTIKCPETNKSRQNIENLSEWMNTKEAAKYLSISKSRLHNLTSSGKVPFYKFGRSNRFRTEELDLVLGKEPRGIRDD
jgi:excisionase family DNA binding protein